MNFISQISDKDYGRIVEETTLVVFSTANTLLSAEEIETECRTKTKGSRYSEDGGKPQRTLQKSGAEKEDTQKSLARRAEIGTATSGVLLCVTAHSDACPLKRGHVKAATCIRFYPGYYIIIYMKQSESK